MRGKQSICFLLSVLLFITGALPVNGVSIESCFYEFVPVPIQPETLPDLRLGDVTGDKEPSAADALEVLQYAVGKRTEFSGKPLYPEVADVDGNGQFAAADALEILQAAVGKRTAYTVQEKYVYPAPEDEEAFFDEAYQKGWGYALELVDQVIEENLNNQTGALYLSAACCSLYLHRVPYYTPWFNQSPVWHALRLKEMAKVMPERIRYLISEAQLLEQYTWWSFSDLFPYGAFAFAYAAESEETEDAFQQIMMGQWVTLNGSNLVNRHIPYYNMTVSDKPVEEWESRIVSRKISDHCTSGSYNPVQDDGFDGNWQTVYDFYGEDLAAIRNWCETTDL